MKARINRNLTNKMLGVSTLDDIIRIPEDEIVEVVRTDTIMIDWKLIKRNISGLIGVYWFVNQEWFDEQL